MPATHNNAGIAASSFVAVKGDAEITTFSEALAFLKKNGGGHLMRPTIEDKFDTMWKVGDEVVIGKGTKNVKLRVLEIEARYENRFGDPTTIGLVLYDTVIVAYYLDGTFTTNSGGHRTPTTCTRLNQFTPDSHHFHVGNRVLWNGAFYADEHANRFQANRAEAESKVVGHEATAPKVKRKKANGPHGTLRWMADSEGNVYSFNDMHLGEAVFPLLLFDEIGKDGDYTGPLPYELVREKIGSGGRYGLYGVAKNDVPLDLVNVHRTLWGMPTIELVREAD